MKGSIKKKSKTRVKYLKSVEEIPDFKSEEEEIEFWKSHSMVDILDKLPEVKVEISGDLKKRIEEHKNKKLLTLRLDPVQIEKAKEIAIRKGIGYLTLMRNWIQEGIERELDNRDKIESSIQPLIEQVEKVENLLKELENKSQHLFSKLHQLQSNLSFARIIDPSHRDATFMRRKSAPPFKLQFENLLGVPNERVMRQDHH